MWASVDKEDFVNVEDSVDIGKVVVRHTRASYSYFALHFGALPLMVVAVHSICQLAVDATLAPVVAEVGSFLPQAHCPLAQDFVNVEELVDIGKVVAERTMAS